MPLETILQAIDAEAERQVADVEAETRAKIAQLESEARANAEAIRQKHIEAAQARLKAEQSRILNRAYRQALQVMLGTREAAISAALEDTAKQLAQFTGTSRYADLLRDLTSESAAALGDSQPLCLTVKADDVPLMKQVIAALGISATVETDLEIGDTVWNSGLGGLIAATPDRRVNVVNTLEMRLQQAAALYRAQLAEWLFQRQATSDE
jgi:vacuolar-type H+-ATPase subunit E/Vma4